MSIESIGQNCTEIASNVQSVYEAGIAQGASIYRLPVNSVAPTKAIVDTALDNLNAKQNTSLARTDIRVVAGNKDTIEIRALAFYGMDKLRILIPLYRLNNIAKVYANAFRNCKALEIADLRSCNSIEDYAFNGCSSLKKILLKKKCVIYPGAFDGIHEDAWRICQLVGGAEGSYLGDEYGNPIVLRSVAPNNSPILSIPDTVMYLYENAFTNGGFSYSEAIINIDSSCYTFPGYLQPLTNISRLTLSNLYIEKKSVNAFGQLFSGKTNNEVKAAAIANHNYNYVPKTLTDLTVSVAYIPSYFFKGCNIENIVVKKGNVERGAFYGSGVKEIAFGTEGSCRIELNALYKCTELRRIYIGKYVTSIGIELLYACNKVSEGFVVHKDNSSYRALSTDENDTPRLLCRGTRLIAYAHYSYEMPDEPSASDEENNNRYNRLTIPEGITSIQQYAIGQANSLAYIRIPASVKTIEPIFINGNSTIGEIDVDSKNAYYESDGGNLYKKNVIVNGYTGRELIATRKINLPLYWILPSDTVKIAERAFYGSQKSWGQIHIPASVKKIDKDAFKSLGSKGSITIAFDVSYENQPSGYPWGAQTNVTFTYKS